MTQFCSISDVHIKDPDGEQAQLFLKFLDHPDVLGSKEIYLLGDIFDLMSGDHVEYLEKYRIIFDKIDDRIKSGIKFYFIEGNHDVHVKKLFERRFKDSIEVHRCAILKEYDGKSFYFGHGDEIDYTDTVYLRYKRFINTYPLEVFANHIMPYSILEAVGSWASKKSKKVGSATFDYDLHKDKFRNLLKEQSDKFKQNYLIMGHTHILDDYQVSDEIRYLNNGYFPRTLSFIVYNKKVVLKKL